MRALRDVLKISGVGAILALVAASMVFASEAGAAAPTTLDFVFTGDVQFWEVPPGVASIDVTACGAEGGDASALISGGDGAGGDGALVASSLAVSVGQTIEIRVGGKPALESNVGGFNGGGSVSGWGAGGGATDLRLAGSGLGDRVLIAGGGGGAGAKDLSAPIALLGGAGGFAGGEGAEGVSGGRGGTQTEGGLGGDPDGTPGILGVGGGGQIGGGGGGLFGGGGGGLTTDGVVIAGAGGGGSSLGDSVTDGACTGDGSLSISYEQCPLNDLFEPNETIGAAVLLSGESSTSGLICMGDVDWFSFPVAAGEEIVLDLSFLHVAGDIDLALFDPGDAQVASSDSATDNESITHFAASTGDYSVRVVGKTDIENGYLLDVVAPRVLISAGNAIVLEGDSGSINASVQLSLSSAAVGPVTVDWTTSGNVGVAGLATPDVDFISASGTVTFLPGELTAQVDVDVMGDDVFEPPFYHGEWGYVVVSNPSPNARIGTASFDNVGIFIIADDDPLPTVDPGAASVFEGDSGTVTVEVPVTLTNPSAQEITVDWATLPGSANPGIAQAGVDFVASSGTVTFAPGETAATIAVEVIGDTLTEPPFILGEWGLIGISNVSPTGLLGTTSFFDRLGVFAIVDDD